LPEFAPAQKLASQLPYAVAPNDSKKGNTMPDGQSAPTLLPMLVWGLVLIVIGAAGVMIFV
jgi:hypothetical protein